MKPPKPKPVWMPVCKSNGITWHKWAAGTRRMCISLLQESNYCESDFHIIKYIPATKARTK